MNYRSLFFAIVQTVGLFVSGFVIPVLGQLLALLTPVPLILAYVNSKAEGFITLIVSSAIIGFLGGAQVAAVFFLTFGLMAVGTSEGMRRQWKPEAAVLLGGLLPVIVLTAAIAYYFSRSGKNPFTEMELYLRGSLGEAAKFYTQLGLREMATVITSVSDTFVHYLVRLVPGLTIAASLVQAACCYSLSRAVIARRQGKEAASVAQPSFADWHAPDVWIWGLIATLTLVLVPDETMRFVGWNVTIVYAVIYLTQGVAVVDHFLRKARIRPFIRGLLHTLILALPSIVFVIALGIVDIWADFRKIRKPVRADDVPPWQRF